MFGYRHWHLCGGAVSTGVRRRKSSGIDDGPDAAVRHEHEIWAAPSVPDECTEPRQAIKAACEVPKKKYSVLAYGKSIVTEKMEELERAARFAEAFGMTPPGAARALRQRDPSLTFDENVAANAVAQREATRMACELDAIKKVRIKGIAHTDGTYTFDLETYTPQQ